MLAGQIKAKEAEIAKLQTAQELFRKRAKEAGLAGNMVAARQLLLKSKKYDKQISDANAILSTLTMHDTNVTRAIDIHQSAATLAASNAAVTDANVDALAEQVQDQHATALETGATLDGAYNTLNMGNDVMSDPSLVEAELAELMAEDQPQLPQDDRFSVEAIEAELASLEAQPSTPTPQRVAAKKNVALFM